jgi:predicted transcriptional regulator
MYKLIAASILIISAIILVSFLFMHNDAKGGYVVKPGDDTSITEMSDAKAISYLDLPLWIKIAAIIDGLLIFISLIGLEPAIISRIQNVLDNRNRQLIFNYVLNNPGCTPSEITASGNMRTGTVKYHVRMLEQEGKIILHKMGKFMRIYRNTLNMDEMEKVIASHLRNDMSRKILNAIMDEPGITNQKLSEKFALDKSTIHWYLQKFLGDNIVEAEVEGKYKKYYVSASAREKLRKYFPLNYQCPGLMRE